MDTAELARLQMVTTILATVANVALVLLTSLYVYLTRQMVLEMRVSHDPSVFVDLEFPDPVGRITIGNSGQSAAKNIRFTVQDGIPWRGKQQRAVGLRAIKAIADGISYLPPGRTLKFTAGVPDWEMARNQTCLLEVQIEYESESGQKRFKREYVIDFGQYEMALYESFRDPNREVAEAIRDTERSRQSRASTELLSWADSTRKRPCPMCAELIPVIARKCSHCGELVDLADSNTEKTS